MTVISITPLLALLLLAIIVVIVAARLRLPYTIALVVLGFALGLLGERLGLAPLFAGIAPLFTPSLFFDVLLPPIIFQAALQINYRLLRARAGLVLFLVFVGVVFTTLFTGLLVSTVSTLPFLAALLLAAILSPTDPIAVVDLFRRLRVPEELSTIVESESLLNDAVGVILFIIVLGVVQTGTTDPWLAFLEFGQLTLGGVAIGLLVAGGVYVLHRRLHDPAVETALSVVAAYGSFLLATDLGASGIIATAIAGIAVGTFVAPRAMDPDVRNSVSVFWNVVVYIANSIIFLAMGLLFALSSLGVFIPLIVLVFATLTVGRVIFVYAHRPLARAWVGSAAELPAVWYRVTALAGIRGAIPVVLALSLLTTSTGLPDSTVHAIVASALGVALLSIIVGNLSSDWYVNRHFGRSPNVEPHPGRFR